MKRGSRRWLELAARDSEVCSWCGTTERLVVDHILSRSRGGTNALENLQFLCLSCNSQKGTRTNSEANKSVRHTSGVEQTGYTMIPNLVLLDRRLSLGARVTYGILKSYAWRDESAWPGQESVADQLGISSRSLRDYLRELVQASLVEVRQRGRGLTNIYLLKDPRFEAADLATAEGDSPSSTSSSSTSSSCSIGSEADFRSRSEVDLHSRPEESADLNGRPEESADLKEFAQSPATTTQTILAKFIESARGQGVDLPRRLVGQFAREIGLLVDEGILVPAIEAGLARMIERRIMSPTLLPNFVAEASLPSPKASANGNGRTLGQAIKDVRAKLSPEELAYDPAAEKKP